MRPSATAAAFLPSSVVRSSISPVAILPIMTAAPIAAAGRFSPLGPRAIAVLVIHDGQCEFLDRINSTVSDDSYEGHSLIQELGRRLQGFLPGRLGYLDDPLRLTGLALHNKHCFTPLLCAKHTPIGWRLRGAFSRENDCRIS